MERQRAIAIDGMAFEGPTEPNIPGMIQEAEGRYLFWLAGQQRNDGDIVEVGSWLGKSAYYLASGAGKSIDCYDDFVWRFSFGRKSGIRLRLGESFQEIFDTNLAGFSVRSHKTHISDLDLSGRSIALLHLDAPKRTREIVQTLKAARKSLVPNVSVVVAQDYKHQMSHDVAMVFEQLSDYLEPLHSVVGTPTVAFVVRKEIPESPLNIEQLHGGSLSAGRLEAMWKSICSKLPQEDQSRIQQGLPFLMADRGYARHAMRLVKETPIDRDFVKRVVRKPGGWRRYWPVLVGTAVFGAAR